VSAKCGGADVDLTEKQITNIKECLKLVGAETVHDLGIENGACFFKCTMEKKGMIDDKGVPHKEKMGDLIDMAIPDNVKGQIKAGLEKCFDEESKDIKMKGDDDMCSTFLPLAMCVHSTFVKIC